MLFIIILTGKRVQVCRFRFPVLRLFRNRLHLFSGNLKIVWNHLSKSKSICLNLFLQRKSECLIMKHLLLCLRVYLPVVTGDLVKLFFALMSSAVNSILGMTNLILMPGCRRLTKTELNLIFIHTEKGSFQNCFLGTI